MKKIYIIFTLLVTLAFLTACTCDTAPIDVPVENLNEICAGYCNQTAPPAEPEAPPVTVQPSVLPDKTTFSNPIPSVETAVIDRVKNSITVKFRNEKNTTILLPLTGSVSKYSKSECQNPQITATYKGDRVEALVTEIKNGEEFTITWDCENLQQVPAAGTLFSADLVFNYKAITGQIYQEMGTVVGRY